MIITNLSHLKCGPHALSSQGLVLQNGGPQVAALSLRLLRPLLTLLIILILSVPTAGQNQFPIRECENKKQPVLRLSDILIQDQ
jgi:hypothetical protein